MFGVCVCYTHARQACGSQKHTCGNLPPHGLNLIKKKVRWWCFFCFFFFLVVHTFYPRIQEAEAVVSLNFETSLVYRIPEQQEQHRETLFWGKKERRKEGRKGGRQTD